MKELYLGLAVVTLILLILSMTVESSLTGSFLNKHPTKKVEKIEKTISATEFKNSLPERAYNKNNLNRIFLRKYYNNKYFNNLNPKKKFYRSN